MDRNIVYPGAIPLDTDLLNVNRNVMIALGYLVQATLGTSTVVDGLACTATVPASLSVNVGPGSITSFTVLDTTDYGSLPADNIDPLMKMGLNIANTSFTLTAPTVSGQSIDYVIEASFAETDLDPVALPYYNANNPAQAYTGPNNSGAAQNTARAQTVQLQLKPGAAASTGSQQPPAADSGWIALYQITVDYGQTEITSNNITQIAGAPFLPFKLPQLAPGVSNLQAFTASGTWTVPNLVSRVRVRLWGAGGAGGSGGGGAGGGGAGGGYSEGYYEVDAGQVLAVQIGVGGTGGGGQSLFGTLASASGGGAGSAGSTTAVGIGSSTPGAGAGVGFLVAGTSGQNGLAFGSGSYMGGMGGAGFAGAPIFGPAGNANTNLNGAAGCFPGGGGSGAIGTGIGGSGAAGLAILEW